MQVDPPEVLLGLKEKTSKPPETRMGDVDDARRAVVMLINEDKPRAIQRALVKGNLDGNPPYGSKPPGHKWEANLNFMSGKARVQRTAGTYSALLAGVETIADCVTEFQPENPETCKWNDRISVEFHALIKTWSQGFDWHVQHFIRQMIVEGFAPVLREQGDNWRFKAIDASAIKVPHGTPSVLDERCEFVVLLDTLRVHELWGKIKDEDTATDRGWNAAAVKWAIRNGNSTNSPASQDWEEWQRKFVSNDLMTGYLSGKGVPVAHIFVQEFRKSGEKNNVSHFILTQHDLKSGDKAENDYLFKHIRCYESYEQAVHVFFANIGDGTWHSVRGLALDSFKHDVMYNRLMCRLADRAFLDSTAFITSESSQARDKLEQVVISGALATLPAQAKIVQTGFAGNASGVMDMIRLVTNSVNGNTGASNPRTIMREDGKGEMPTLGQVRAQIQQDSQLSNDAIRLTYLTLDRLFDNMLKCACRQNTTDKQAKEFQERCVAAGVPIEALRKCRAGANRMSGYGSAAMKDAVVQQLQQLVPSFPEEGKNNFLNFAIMAATENPGLVNYFNPPQTAPTPDDALVVLENAAIQQGETPVIFSGQNHVIHLQGHLDDTAQKMGPLSDAIEQGHSDPTALDSAYKYLQVMGPHIEAHLAPLRSDPMRKQLAKQFELQLSDLTAFHGKLRQAIRQAARTQSLEAQEGQNAIALGALDQAKVRSAQIADQIAVSKAERQTRIKEANAANNIKLRTAETLQRMRLASAGKDTP